MTVVTPEDYTSRVEAIYDHTLKDRIVGTLRAYGDVFRGSGYTVSGPHDLSDDEYRWYIAVERDDLPEPVDISIEVAESLSYGDDTEGINLGLSIVANGGEIIGGLCPYNYTPQVWASVYDVDEIENRIKIIENSDPAEAALLIGRWAEGSDAA